MPIVSVVQEADVDDCLSTQIQEHPGNHNRVISQTLQENDYDEILCYMLTRM